MITYNLSATEILRFLDLEKQTEASHLKDFEKRHHIKLPNTLIQFMLVASNNPLFSTSDIWKDVDDFRFFYKDIKERIDEEQEIWNSEPNSYGNDEYFQFAQLPKEKWPEKCSDYLEIGCDFGAGVVSFGIRTTDLKYDDPPIYFNHEENSLTDWEPCYDKLSNYLRAITCDVLLCTEYQTAKKVLAKHGWKFKEYKDPMEVENLLLENTVDVSKSHNFTSFYVGETTCCCDEGANTLFIIKHEKNVLEINTISK